VFFGSGRDEDIRSGAADCEIEHIPSVITERVFYHIGAWNTIAIDEKPMNMKKFAPNSYRILKRSKHGPVYKPIFKMMKQSHFYLVGAITCHGLLLFAISDVPYNTDSFNQFLINVTRSIPPDGVQRWLLIDNALFHAIDPVVQEILCDMKIGVTHTAPSTCFFDPIEEFFGELHAVFLRRYEKYVLMTGRIVPLTREEIRQLIVQCVLDAGNHDMSKIYARDCLL
jgi:hypothetical protein